MFRTPLLPMVATVVPEAMMKPLVEVAVPVPVVVDVALASTSPFEVVELAALVNKPVLDVIPVASPPPPPIVPPVTMPVIVPVQVAPDGQHAT